MNRPTDTIFKVSYGLGRPGRRRADFYPAEVGSFEKPSTVPGAARHGKWLVLSLPVELGARQHTKLKLRSSSICSCTAGHTIPPW